MVECSRFALDAAPRGSFGGLVARRAPSRSTRAPAVVYATVDLRAVGRSHFVGGRQTDAVRGAEALLPSTLARRRRRAFGRRRLGDRAANLFNLGCR
jgi:hypothetical protein